MGTASYSRNDNAFSVLFGPQSVLTSESLLELRTTLRENQDLQYLSALTADLPSIWPRIVEVWPELNVIPANNELDKLSSFLNGGPMVDILNPVNNILLCPLTVIIQIVDFWKLTHGLGPVSDAESQIRNVQGFCTGFLTAAAVSCSKNEEQLQDLASKAVRLALCLGAVVDLDSRNILDCALTIAVRWKSTEQLQQLQGIMKQYPKSYISVVTDSRTVTVTIAERDEMQFKSRLLELNIPVMSLTSRGRWHHSDHLRGAQAILTLCRLDERFRLPDTDVLNTDLLSNIDGKPAANGSLSDVAVRSILIAQARWDLIFDVLPEPVSRHVCIGEKVAIPRDVDGTSFTQILEMSLNHVSSEDLKTEYRQDDLNVEYLDSFPPNAVAVIGMACRYPEADDVEQLWDLISEGKSVIRALPEERFKLSDLRRDPKGPFWGGFVRDLAAFDHRFFGISGREAKSMDPQQRLCLQVAYEAMESAGYYGLRSDSFDHDVGCYIGCANDDYFDNVSSHPANAFSLTGTLRSFISGRVSHHLGLTGPSMVLDTACSASAVAIHTACKALQTEECSVAIAGGVCSMSSARMTQHLITAKFLSPTGVSGAFDADANGYCRAEGAGLIVLRPLKDALQYGNHVLGIISGTAINQGSNETAIFVPDGQSQDSLYKKVLTNSGTTPGEITYVEAHGTGTQVGDPIEFKSIRKILGGPERKHEVFVGSVKDNIGHTEASSGTASLIKTILMMQKDTIPKQANFKKLNPRIEPLGKDRVLIPTRAIEWKVAKRVALINNYGSCGSNAAIILKDPTVRSSQSIRNTPIEMSQYPVFISGKTAEAVRLFSTSLKQRLVQKGYGTLSGIAYNLTLKQNRSFEHFLVTSSSDIDDLQSQLERIVSGDVELLRKPDRKPPVVLCFGGQDGRITYISKELYLKSALLRRHISDCDRVCTKELSLPSLYPTVFSPEPIDNIVKLHCVLFTIQYACAKSWLDSGLKVDRLLGHSFGQLTALCVSGSLSLFDAMRLVSERARLVEIHSGTKPGSMLAFEGSEKDLNRCLELAREECESFSADIACYNGPQSFVVAGDQSSITALEQVSRVVPNTVRTKRLNNSHAFHSRLLDDAFPGLLKIAGQLKLSSPTIPIEACSVEDWSHITPDKIARHTREPVRFSEAVRRIEQQFNTPTIWLEAGSGSPIIPMLKRTVSSSVGHVYIPTLLSGGDAQMNLTRATCRLWSNGIEAQFWPFHRCQSSQYKWINLPPYQFAKTKHWLEYRPNPVWESPSATAAGTGEDHQPELIRLLSGQGIQSEYIFEVNPKHEMYQLSTKGHKVLEEPTCPISTYIEFIVAAVRLIWNPTALLVPQLSDLTFFSPLTLKHSGRVLLRLRKRNAMTESWTFVLFTGNKQNESIEHVIYATGRISAAQSETTSVVNRFQSLSSLVLQRCSEIERSSKSVGFKGPTVYQAMRPVVTYLDYSQGIQSAYSIGNEVVARVALPTGWPMGTGTSFCVPVLVDNFMQVSDILANCFTRDDDNTMWVCNCIGEMMFTSKFLETARKKQIWLAYSKYEKPTREKLQCDTFVFDPDSGRLVFTIMAISFRRDLVGSLARAFDALETSSRRLSQDVPIEASTNYVAIDVAARDTAGSCVQQDNLRANVEADINLEGSRRPDTVATMPITETVKGEKSRNSSSGILSTVQQMLSDIIEMPVEHITPASTFESLGADSLFITEIFTEVNQQFGISLSLSDFATVKYVQDLVQRITDSISPPDLNESLALDAMSASASVMSSQVNGSQTPIDMETFAYGQRDGTPLSADVYYPPEHETVQNPLAIALLIHGGGHTVGTRKDIRRDQTQALLKSGFVAVSIDYRLCPEITLKDGPMQDVCDALFWIRNTLPRLTLCRSDIRVDRRKVVVIGWSSGGHLAMSLGWTAQSLGVAPPEAILAFYCPTDYEDDFWQKPNLPYSQKPVSTPDTTYNHLYESLHDKPIVGYTPAASLRALGGWMSLDDPRSRIVLHMNWEGKHLPILLGGLKRTGDPASKLVTTPSDPSVEDIRDISPLAHIRAGTYTVPTFLIHGTRDDHVPWRQSQRTYEALVQQGVPARVAIVRDAVHLFDMLRSFGRNKQAVDAVNDGLDFLRSFV